MDNQTVVTYTLVDIQDLDLYATLQKHLSQASDWQEPKNYTSVGFPSKEDTLYTMVREDITTILDGFAEIFNIEERGPLVIPSMNFYAICFEVLKARAPNLMSLFYYKYLNEAVQNYSKKIRIGKASPKEKKALVALVRKAGLEDLLKEEDEIVELPETLPDYQDIKEELDITKILFYDLVTGYQGSDNNLKSKLMQFARGMLEDKSFSAQLTNLDIMKDKMFVQL